MRIDQRAFSAMLLGAALQGAVFPLPAAQPAPAVPAKVPVAAIYEYRAEVSGPARRQGSVKAGGIDWKCSGARCTTAGPWPVPSVEACRALAREVGVITRYGHAKRELTAEELQRCNSGVASAAAGAKKLPAAIGKAGIAAGAKSGVQATLDPNVAANLTPQQHATPMAPGISAGRAGASAIGAPVPGGAAAQAAPGLRPGMAATPQLIPGAGSGAGSSGMGGGRYATPGMIDEIRTAAAGIATRPNIAAVHGNQADGYCSTGGFRVVGTNFGASQGGRRLVLARRNVAVAEATVRSWSDTLIEADFGTHSALTLGVAYNVGLQDERGQWISNVDRQVLVCDELQVLGTIRVENCGAGPENIVLEVGDGLNVWRVPVTAQPGNDFLFQYRSALPRVGQYTLRSRLTGIECRGGAWTPEMPLRFSASYRQPQLRQDLQFAVPAREFRLPLTAVAGLVRDAFQGLVVHLNNFDPATGGERANDSYVRLPEGLGGGEWQLNLPPVRMGPRTYYVNDVNLESTAVRAAERGLRVQLDFESRDNAGRMELVGTCRDDAGCIVGAPDVDLTLRVIIDLALAQHFVSGAGYTVSFSDVSVTAEPTTMVHGACLLNWCALVGAPLPISECVFDVCDFATGYRSTIRSAVESSIRSALDTQDVRNRVGRAIREELTRLGIGSLTGVRIEGGTLVLTYLDNAR